MLFNSKNNQLQQKQRKTTVQKASPQKVHPPKGNNALINTNSFKTFS